MGLGDAERAGGCRTGMAEAAELSAVFEALGSHARLALFRRIVRAGPDGVDAAALAQELRTTGSALTLHLRRLAEAGLIAPCPGRPLRFVADLARLIKVVRAIAAEREGELSVGEVV